MICVKTKSTDQLNHHYVSGKARSPPAVLCRCSADRYTKASGTVPLPTGTQWTRPSNVVGSNTKKHPRGGDGCHSEQ